jgi:hypothetical protein
LSRTHPKLKSLCARPLVNRRPKIAPDLLRAPLNGLIYINAHRVRAGGHRFIAQRMSEITTLISTQVVIGK